MEDEKRFMSIPLEVQKIKKSPTKRSTAYLDGIRGLAAFLVFIQHYCPGFDMVQHEQGFGENGSYLFASLPFVRLFLTGGNPAVSTFFVLSGFVLAQGPLKIIRKENLRGAAKLVLLSALIRRPIRLWSPCLVIALLTAFGMHLPGGPYANGPFSAEPTLGQELIQWVFKTAAFFNPFRSISSIPWYWYGMIMWTIPIEFQGSCLVYILLAIEAFFKIPLIYVVSAQTALLFICMITGCWMMGCFVAGVIIAYIHICELDDELIQRLTSRGKTLLFSCLFILAWYLLCQPAGFGGRNGSANTIGWQYLTLVIPRYYDDSTYFRWWHSWGSILLIYVVLHLEWLQRFFSTRLLQYLGRISFMLYLIHVPIVWTVGNWVRCALGTCQVDEETFRWKEKLLVKDIGPTGLGLRFILAITILTAIIVPLSEILVWILDKPVVGFSKWFARELGLERRIEKKRDKLRYRDEDGASQPLLGEPESASLTI